MDLILLDTNFKKIKPIKSIVTFDATAGLKSYSENDYILKIPYKKENLFDKNQFVIYGTTEFGGIIKRREIDTEKNEITYSGLSIRGILNNSHKDVEDLTVKGSVVDHISTFLEIGNVPLNIVDFVNELGDESITLKYEGATSALHCIDRVLKNLDATMDISVVNQRLRVKISPIKTHLFDGSQVDLIFEENWERPTAVYAVNNDLDIGARAYLQADGTISNQEYYKGLESIEKVITSDLPTEEELYAEAEKELRDARETTASEIFVDVQKADVGDMVKASILEIGVKVTKKIVEKRIAVKNGNAEITYTLEG